MKVESLVSLDIIDDMYNTKCISVTISIPIDKQQEVFIKRRNHIFAVCLSNVFFMNLGTKSFQNHHTKHHKHKKSIVITAQKANLLKLILREKKLSYDFLN